MNSTPRKFDSEIRINELGKWIYRGSEITQANVLIFFKSNIREDESGIYIINEYGSLVEYGYIESKCIFLNITDYVFKEDLIYLQGEDGSFNPISDFDFYSDKEEKIFCMRKTDKYIRFRFNRQVLNFISKHLMEENGNYFLQIEKDKIPVNQYSPSLKVEIPEIYRK